MSKQVEKNAKPKNGKKGDDWPVIRERTRKGGRIVYMVDTCRRLPTRERPTFRTREEAELACEQYRIQLKNSGNKYFDLTPAEREDATSALQICRELNISTLTEALTLLRPYLAPPSGTISLELLRDEFFKFFQSKVDKRQRSLRHFETLSARASFITRTLGADCLANEVTARILWDALANEASIRNWKRNTLKRYCDAANQMFDFAVKKGYVASNPMMDQGIQFEKEEALEKQTQQSPEILSVKQARDLLRVAHGDNGKRGMLAYVAICLFTGSRPEAEVSKMTWEDIDFEEGRIYVRPNKSKNVSSARCLEMCPTLIEWLMLCRQDKRMIPDAWRFRWKKTRAEAGLPRTGDLTRHSWASYSYALHGKKTKLTDEMGHVGQDMLRHYLSVRPKIRRDAKTYFALTPNVVTNKTYS
jgi:integrase